MTEPIWLTAEDVLGLYKQHGDPGIRDLNGVEAATARPQQHWHYAGTVDIFTLAALYVESFATTQHFVDGNKRVAFHSALLFLRLNGYRLVADIYEAAQAVLDVSNKEMSVEQLGGWFAKHCERF